MAKAKLAAERVFHALGDPTRRKIVERLSARPLSVSQLAEPLGITLTAVAQHLSALEEAGLVRSEKAGRVRTCQIEREGLAILEKWLSDRRSDIERELDRLGDLLAGDD